MFDDQSFSTEAFSDQSWLFAIVAVARREVVRLRSWVTRLTTLRSPLE